MDFKLVNWPALYEAISNIYKTDEWNKWWEINMNDIPF
jgi:hypothetical protein